VARVLPALLLVTALLGAIWYAVASERPRASGTAMTEVQPALAADSREAEPAPAPGAATAVAPVDAREEQQELVSATREDIPASAPSSEARTDPQPTGGIEVRVHAPGDAEPEGRILLHHQESLGRSTHFDRPRGKQRLEHGRAVFDAVEPGRGYRLSYDGDVFVGSSDVLEVVAAATREVELELRPGVVLVGNVRDEDGAPLEGVHVEATLQDRDVVRPLDERGAMTRADGRFQLGALPAGDFTLTGELDGYAVASLPLGELEEGATRTDLELVLTRGGSIAGRVLWPDGTPAQAAIELWPASEFIDWDSGPRDASGESGSDGRFRITGLSPALYTVRARTQRSEDEADEGATPTIVLRRKWTTWTAERERVKLGTESLVLELEMGHTLSGRVRDDLGAAVDDFALSAHRVNAFHWDDPGRPSSFHDAGGAFELTGLEPGEWGIRAGAAGHASSEEMLVTIPAAEPIELFVPREARVQGVVLDAPGQPREGVEVRVATVREGRPLQRFEDELHDTTDAAGVFELVRLRPGRLAIAAFSPTGAPSERRELELAPGEELTDVVLRLRAGARLTGEVLGLDGRPQAELEVGLDGDGAFASCTTDRAGRFEAEGLAPGPLEVVAEIAGGLELHARVELRDGETTHVQLAPPRTTVRVHGHVTVDGQPLPNADVFADPVVDDGGGAQSAATETDAEGAYALTLPGSGRYSLLVHSGPVAELSFRAVLDVPEVAELAFDVAIPIGRISGRVRDRSGAPLAGIWVQSEPERHEGGSHGGARSQTDEDGRYELRVPAGMHGVSAGGDMGWGSPDTRRFVAQRVSGLTIAAGAHLRDVDFVLADGGTLTGHVRANGTGAAYARIWTLDAAGARPLGWSDEDGSFRIEGVEPGERWIAVTNESMASRSATRVVVTVGGNESLELALEPATAVHVRVLDAGGRPVGCEIELLDDANRRPPFEPVANGEALVAPLPPGRYIVRAHREEKLAERRFEVGAGEPSFELVLAFD